MNKQYLILFFLCLCNNIPVIAQRKCGFDDYRKTQIALHPELANHFAKQKASLQAIADNFTLEKNLSKANKQTSSSPAPVPVIFHIIINETQFLALGGSAGIKQRCDSQIAVLNRDYNKQNADSVNIPSSWKPFYGNVGIHFALALIDTNGNTMTTPGYDLKIITNIGFNGSTNSYSDAKHSITGGADAWDNTKYMNVWCINFADVSGLLGITVAKSFTFIGGGSTANNEQGICIAYNALGKRVLSSDSYPPGSGGITYDEGKTLTHEVGHFFEIWHVWGDDSGLCPWNGGSDDGLSDTPPQGDNTYGNPAYTITGGTLYDGCQYNATVNKQPIGIACLSYMDYTDDAGMLLFTTQQAAVMKSQVSVVGGVTGENIALVQNPGLTTIVEKPSNLNLSIYPNPTKGILNITFDTNVSNLQNIEIYNLVGQAAMSITIDSPQKSIYYIDISRLNKGIYFVNCNFANGKYIQKILLQ